MNHFKHRTPKRAPERVLVLGSDTRSFLSVIRSLGRRGLEVHVAWCSDDSPARQSRYISAKHVLPTPWESPGEWKRPFIDLLEDKSFELVVPCNDPSLIPLQENRDELSRYARVYCLNDAAYAVAFDKNESTRLADSLDIPVAQSHLIYNSDDAEHAADVFGFPIILKPLHSYVPSQLRRRNIVQRIESRSQLMDQVRQCDTKAPLLIQEYFHGIGAGVEFLAHEGRLLASFQHVRLHEPDSGGGSSHRKSVRVDSELLEATRKLVSALDYTGVGMVEFRIDPSSSRWIFIEINGRFWGSLPLAIASGADFPAYLYDYLVNGRREFPQRYRSGLCCRNLTKDLGWYRESLWAVLRRRRRIRTFARELLGDFLGLILLRERSDTFVLDDVRPGIVEVKQLVGNIAARARAKISIAARGLPPVKWLQRHRAVQAFRKARHILFICKGNICRSPFAEQYLRSLVPTSVQVSSCGYYPKSHRPSPATARTAAGSFGVALESHRSRVLTDDDIEASDVIFVFDEENRRTLRNRFPHAKKRIHMLGSLSSHTALSISDPYGGNDQRFHRTYEIIKCAIDSLVSSSIGSAKPTADPNLA